jgi:hypothetical protein
VFINLIDQHTFFVIELKQLQFCTLLKWPVQVPQNSVHLGNHSVVSQTLTELKIILKTSASDMEVDLPDSLGHIIRTCAPRFRLDNFTIGKRDFDFSRGFCSQIIQIGLLQLFPDDKTVLQ